ncbi:MAG: membrane protein insertase YidC [Woeseiaceae bacterium]
MDNQRLFAWAFFGLLIMMTWQAWQQDYAAPAASAPAAVVESAVPATIAGDDLPVIDDVVTPTRATPTNDGELPSVSTIATDAAYIDIQTDVLALRINLKGGDIVSAKLPAYPISKDTPDEYVTLLSDVDGAYGVYRSGLTSGQPDTDPNHLASFTAKQDRYVLPDGADTLVVPLTWTNAEGLVVEKQFVLNRGSYRIDMNFRIRNDSQVDWAARPYARIVHAALAADRSMFNVESYSFKGPVVYDGEKYKKHAPEDLIDEPVRKDGVTGGWVAAIEHHFLSAIIPANEGQVRLEAGRSGDNFVTGIVGAAVTVPAGQAVDIPVTLFTGPKLQEQLNEISPRLSLTVDYGILTLLANPLFWLLSTVFSFVGNWGWAIIIVTFLIKLAFYKLTEKSGRSIAKMRKLQPRLKSIQERYKDDRQKLSQAMMDLYKREKVNPAAGCLPVLIQMPFFLAFYWVLLESVEMRQAPFMLWIQDLSSRDPFFVLPLLMGGAMMMQQRLNPAPADPVQAKVMKVLPVIFTVFFAFFPAGLVLYWFTNTLLGVAQQWKINKVVEAEDKKARD